MDIQKITYPNLNCDASSLLALSMRREAVDSLIRSGEIIETEDKFISSYKLYSAEIAIAEEIRRIQSSAIGFDFDLSDAELEEEQTPVPSLLKDNPVLILSGVPGSGKTYTVSRIIKQLHDNEIESILVVAPSLTV